MQEAKHAEQREAVRYLREEFAQRQAQALRNKAAVEADRGNIAIYIPAGPPPAQLERDDHAGAAQQNRDRRVERHVARHFVVGPAGANARGVEVPVAKPPAGHRVMPVVHNAAQYGHEGGQNAAVEQDSGGKHERRSRGEDQLTPERR